MPTVTVPIEAGLDDQRMVLTGAAYPPVGTPTRETAQDPGAGRSVSGGTFEIANSLWRFNTGTYLPDNATVTGAYFEAKCSNSVWAGDGKQIMFEYYDWDGSSTSDYSDTAPANNLSTTAHAGTNISSFSAGTVYQITLTNFANISTTGVTELRAHVSDNTQPTSGNYLAFWNFENGGGHPVAKLVITYVLPDGPGYIQLGPDGAGKKERTQTRTIGADTVHEPYMNFEDVTSDFQPRVLNAKPASTDEGLLTRTIDESLGTTRRYTQTYYGIALSNTNGSDVLQTMTKVEDFVTGSSATTFTVPAGRTFRVQGLVICGRIVTNTSPAIWGMAILRADTSATATNTSPIVAVAYSEAQAAALAVNIGMPPQWAQIQEGIDLPSGTSFGVSMLNMSGNVTRTDWTICLLGYEY